MVAVPGRGGAACADGRRGLLWYQSRVGVVQHALTGGGVCCGISARSGRCRTRSMNCRT